MTLTSLLFEKRPVCHEEYLNFAYKHSWGNLEKQIDIFKNILTM